MTNTTTPRPLTKLEERIKDNPRALTQLTAVTEYNVAERGEVNLTEIKSVLNDRWLHCQDYDFTNLQTYLSALTENNDDLEKFGMAYIRLDDLTEIFRLANEQVVREWEEASDAVEAQDHGSEIVHQLSSVSWNLNRIASQLEKDSKASAQPRSDEKEKLVRKNTLDLLRGGNS